MDARILGELQRTIEAQGYAVERITGEAGSAPFLRVRRPNGSALDVHNVPEWWGVLRARRNTALRACGAPPLPAPDPDVKDAASAVQVLLASCPELTVAWHALCTLMGAHDASEIGIFNVIGHVVLPALGSLLTSGRDSRFEDSYPGALPQEERQRQDLLRRIYAAFDRWAASGDPSIRDATVHEMTEGGYGSLSDADLLRGAGPALRVLVKRLVDIPPPY